ncbi:MAG: hypothetical protein ACYC91_14775 [Solirubrobacteraceae bacterium]
MASSSSSSDGPAASHAEGGIALVAIGALLLFVSLFLDWYQPGRSAWAVFEVWDLVLAGLSLMALAAVGGRLGFGRSRPEAWLVGPSVAALVIVLASLLNHPPAAAEADPMIGIWLALVAAVLMVVGVALSVAGVSVAINVHGGTTGAGAGGAPEPTAGRGVTDMRRRRLRRSATGAASPPNDPVTPGRVSAGELPTEATRVLDDDPASRREPPAPV